MTGFEPCPPAGRRTAFFKKISISASPSEVYRALKSPAPGVFLESARVAQGLGRYSLVGTDPFLIFQFKNGCATAHLRGKQKKVIPGNPFGTLKKLLRQYRVASSVNDPPFSGGAVGFVGYEAKALLEPSLSQSAREDLGLPWLYFLFLDRGVLFDHKTGEVYVFCVSPNEASANRSQRLLEKKILRNLKKKTTLKKQSKGFAQPTIISSVMRDEFMLMVEKTKAYIRRGDIYQANLSQRLSFSLKDAPEAIYEKLKKVNPSSFFGFLDAGDFQILSGSPERLLKLEGRELQTRPIAGTRSRHADPKKDKAAALELLLSEKERAEHIMLVDLERNDLGRVAEYGSVVVDELMALENYSHVKHIVSNVRATLKDGLDAVDAFRAFFPGGTITGTPKIRSMQVIDELETIARGPYTGSLGYFSFTGDMDFNIIIRSLVVKDGRAHLQVGAGIVADSDPGKEYDETLYKAQAVLTAIFGPAQTRAILRQLRAS